MITSTLEGKVASVNNLVILDKLERRILRTKDLVI